MAKQSARATKPVAAIVAAPSIAFDATQVIDAGKLITFAKIKRVNVGDKVIEAGAGTDQAVKAFHSIALGIMAGVVRATDIESVTFPTSIRQVKSVALAVAKYADEHGADKLRLAWNTKQATATRITPVSLNGLKAAIVSKVTPKEADGKPAPISAKQGKDANAQGEREPSPDVVATLAAIVDTLESGLTPDKIVARIGALPAIKAAIEAHAKAKKEAA